MLSQSCRRMSAKHWRVWRVLGADPRVVRVLRKGLYYRVPATMPSVLQAWILQASNRSCQVGGPGLRSPADGTQGGYRAGPSRSGLFPFPPVLGFQEGREVETSYRPEGLESDHRHPDVCHGNAGVYQSSGETRGLGGVHRSVRCILPHPDKSKVQEVPDILSQGNALAVQSSAVRSLHRPMDFYQGYGEVRKMAAVHGITMHMYIDD